MKIVRYKLIWRSKNSKTGPMVVTYSSENSCPVECPHRGEGCYNESHWNRKYWTKTGIEGMNFKEFVEEIWALPPGIRWRYGIAGDLPGHRSTIDRDEMTGLILANRGKQGWCYSHKPTTGANAALIAMANANGFTVNISCDDPVGQADEAWQLGIGPVTTIVPLSWGDWRKAMTPGGVQIIRCPAEYNTGEDENGKPDGSLKIQCNNCGSARAGNLCYQAGRRSIIGFTPHGSGSRKVDLVVRSLMTRSARRLGLDITDYL